MSSLSASKANVHVSWRVFLQDLCHVCCVQLCKQSTVYNQNTISLLTSTLKTEAAHFSDTSVNTVHCSAVYNHITTCPSTFELMRTFSAVMHSYSQLVTTMHISPAAKHWNVAWSNSSAPSRVMKLYVSIQTVSVSLTINVASKSVTSVEIKSHLYRDSNIFKFRTWKL